MWLALRGSDGAARARVVGGLPVTGVFGLRSWRVGRERTADPQMTRCSKGWFWVRSRVQTITPERGLGVAGGEYHDRPVSKAVVRSFAQAMRRGEWMVTHQGIAFDTRGVLVDGQHRLAAIIEADRPVELTVFTEVGEGTFDVLDAGKRRSAADVLAIEGEKSSTMLAAMVRTVWLYENRPELNWSGGAAAVSNHQIVHTLESHPKLREYVGVGERVAGGHRDDQKRGRRVRPTGRPGEPARRPNARGLTGVNDGAGLVKSDPRLLFRRVMFNMARRHAGQVLRRRDTREHVGLYLTAFNAWATGQPISQLRFTPRDTVPAIAKAS